jgi:hypothetical protein
LSCGNGFPKAEIEHGHDDHVQRRGTRETEHDHHGHRRLDLTAGLARRERDRNKRKTRRERRHQDWHQPLSGATRHRELEVGHRFMLLQMPDVRHQHDPIAGRNAEQRDKADDGRDRQDRPREIDTQHAPSRLRAGSA